jgi:hypothetical protein
VRESSENLSRKTEDLRARLDRRIALLDRQEQLSSVPPRIVTAALVLPVSTIEAELPKDAPLRAVETTVVERRGVDAVLRAERSLGREPIEMAHNNPGYDIQALRGDDPTIFIEVKARIAGATDFFVTHTEIRYGQNAVPHYRLALVRVDPADPAADEVRYIEDPFRELRMGDFEAGGVQGKWMETWAKGRTPF